MVKKKAKSKRKASRKKAVKAVPVIAPEKPKAPTRLLSLDYFRGFVILTMIFVNDLSWIKDIPAWAKHATADQDWYTFVDVVFPAFLFIVGASIPFSIGRRLEAGERGMRLWSRILPRVASLIFLGVVMVNGWAYVGKVSGFGQAWWTLLFYIPFYILWSTRPKAGWLRAASWAALLYALIIFRRDAGEGALSWFKTEWWGILGIIGWAYLAAVAAYIWTGRNITKLVVVFSLMLAWYEAGRGGVLEPLNNLLGGYLDTGSLFGTHAAMVVAGIFVGERLKSSGGKDFAFVLKFGLLLLFAGYLTRPLHGFSKIHGTVGWSLASVGWSALVLGLFVWLVERKGKEGWLAWLGPVGANPLFAYLLPTLLGAFFTVCAGFGWDPRGIIWWHTAGLPGALNVLAWTGLLLAITAWATRRNWILKM